MRANASVMWKVSVALVCLSALAAAAAPAKPGPTDKDAPKEFTKTKSGLKYRILRKSKRARPKANSIVQAHYRGWLPDKKDPSQGKEFDSSYRRGRPSTFPLNRVIPGWTEGLQLVGVGGMIELEIPAELGYGEDGFPGAIPPGATLRFIVELVEVTEPPKPLEPGPKDKDADQEFTVTKSGLKYRILRKGKGASPKPSNHVTIHYRGWLPEPEEPERGFVFDSSYRTRKPATFLLKGLIKGWIEGLQLVKVGGMIELEVPPKLAYGDQAVGDIPANSTLRFIVELIDVR